MLIICAFKGMWCTHTDFWGICNGLLQILVVMSLRSSSATRTDWGYGSPSFLLRGLDLAPQPSRSILQRTTPPSCAWITTHRARPPQKLKGLGRMRISTSSPSCCKTLFPGCRFSRETAGLPFLRTLMHLSSMSAIASRRVTHLSSCHSVS